VPVDPALSADGMFDVDDQYYGHNRQNNSCFRIGNLNTVAFDLADPDPLFPFCIDS
jgi:hypothetical protein